MDPERECVEKEATKGVRRGFIGRTWAERDEMERK
jgi:hypothetical protein